MRKIEINNNLNPNFIGAWNIDNTKLCKDIIDFFEKNKSLQTPGEIGKGIDKNIKSSTDISISPNELSNSSHLIFKDYINELFSCYTDYIETWPFLKRIKSIDLCFPKLCATSKIVLGRR